MVTQIRISIVICTATILCATTAVAKDKYLGLQYADTTYSEVNFQDNKPSALIARIGQSFNDTFSIEGRFGTGLSDHFYSDPPYQFGVEINSLTGVYGAAYFPASSWFDFYGLLGLSRIQVTKTNINSGVTYSIAEDVESSFSYAFGSDIRISDSMAINLEYGSYLNKERFDLTAVSLGLKFHFD